MKRKYLILILILIISLSLCFFVSCKSVGKKDKKQEPKPDPTPDGGKGTVVVSVKSDSDLSQVQKLKISVTGVDAQELPYKVGDNYTIKDVPAKDEVAVGVSALDSAGKEILKGEAKTKVEEDKEAKVEVVLTSATPPLPPPPPPTCTMPDEFDLRYTVNGKIIPPLGNEYQLDGTARVTRQKGVEKLTVDLEEVKINGSPIEQTADNRLMTKDATLTGCDLTATIKFYLDMTNSMAKTLKDMFKLPDTVTKIDAELSIDGLKNVALKDGKKLNLITLAPDTKSLEGAFIFNIDPAGVIKDAQGSPVFSSLKDMILGWIKGAVKEGEDKTGAVKFLFETANPTDFDAVTKIVGEIKSGDVATKFECEKGKDCIVDKLNTGEYSASAMGVDKDGKALLKGETKFAVKAGETVEVKVAMNSETPPPPAVVIEPGSYKVEGKVKYFKQEWLVILDLVLEKNAETNNITAKISNLSVNSVATDDAVGAIDVNGEIGFEIKLPREVFGEDQKLISDKLIPTRVSVNPREAKEASVKCEIGLHYYPLLTPGSKERDEKDNKFWKRVLSSEGDAVLRAFQAQEPSN